MPQMARAAVSRRSSGGGPTPAGDEVPVRRPPFELPRRPGNLVLLTLGVVVLASLGLHVWGIKGDLPYAPDVDEPIFVKAAVRLLQHRTLDPGWFGHPGSTTIYPTAALIGLWYEVAAHIPPFAHAMPGLGKALVVDPTPYYLIGRLVSVIYGVGCVFATWLLARRIVGDVGGVLAAIVPVTTAIVVGYGQLVRTDTAGMFFALIALWLAIRAMEDRRSRDWYLSAIAIGLAISTRYFYASLVVPYCVAAWLWFRSRRDSPTALKGSRPAWAVPIVALLFAPATFLITSPFVLLDLHRVVADLRFEARAVHPGADGLTPIGNLAWYVGQVIPATFGPLIVILAIIGVVVIARRDARATAVLMAFGISYLVVVSASPLHWDRYVIPLVPIIGILVAAAAMAIGDGSARALGVWRARFGRGRPPTGSDTDLTGRHRRQAVSLASAILVVLLVPSFLAVVTADRQRATPSTRVLATDWIVGNLPPGSRIAEEMYTAYLDGTTYDVLQMFSLTDRSLDRYRADGYRYLVRSSSIAGRFSDATRYPTEYAFQQTLMATGRLLASFEPGQDRAGPQILIYDIAAS